jgi:hypothetical protein
MGTEENYKKLLEDAAWDADSNFDYKINFKEEAPNEVLLTRGEIVLNPKDIKYTYKFAIGVDGNILFNIGGHHDLIIKRRVYDEMINFNESLAKSIGATKIMIADETNPNVINLYFEKGYNANKNNPLNLEKILK